MKTKIITTVGLSALALTLGHSTANAQEKGTVTASALNVRSGPGVNYNVKGGIYKGNTVVILEKQGKWLKVKLSNGTTGWINNAYVKIGSTTTSNETSFSNIQINCRARLNVRSGPSTSYSIKRTVSYGEVYKKLDKLNGWYKIQLPDGSSGWVNGIYVKETTKDVSNQSPISIEDNNKEETINNNGKVTSRVNLNVRSGPGTSYSLKSSLRPGQVVVLCGKSNGWYKIKLSNETQGWVSSNYIAITNESVSNTTENTINSQKGEAVVNFAMAQLGKPYVWGANGPGSFDCSGFTRYVYLYSTGVSLPRISSDQARQGTYVSRSNMKKGDLVYFATVTPGTTSHVGIYIGNNQFIHASGSLRNPDKVKISSLIGYYGNVLLGARRLL